MSIRVVRSWHRFLLRRKLLLTLRDTPALLLVSMCVAVGLPLLSMQGARRMGEMVRLAEQFSMSAALDRYLVLFLFWQTALLVLGLLYVSKAHRRPPVYRFLPVAYNRYLALCMRRAILGAFLVTATMYGPLYWYIEKGLGGIFSGLDWLLLGGSIAGVALAAAFAYSVALKLARTFRWWRVLGAITGTGAALVAMHLYVFESWGSMLRQATPMQVLVAAACLMVGVWVLRLSVRTQPEQPLSQAATMHAHQSLRRRPFMSRARANKATVLGIVQGRQLDILVVSIGMSVVIVGLSFVMRLAEPSSAVVAQTIVVSVLPYAVALYTLSARSNFMGAQGDGLRYVPLTMSGYAKYLLVLSVIWQIVITAGLVVAVAHIGGVSLDMPGFMDFVYITTVSASLAYGVGTVFYDTTIGSRIAGVALFVGISVILQAGLQELAVYEYGLEVAAVSALVGVALAVTALEKTRRSVYAGA